MGREGERERRSRKEREREREWILMSCQSHRYDGEDRRGSEIYACYIDTVLNHDLETKRQNLKLVSAVQLSFILSGDLHLIKTPVYFWIFFLR